MLRGEGVVGYFERSTVMKAVKSLVSRFVKGEEGVTLIEYGLLAALVAIACVTILTHLGTHLNNTFNNVNNQIPGN